MFLFSPKKKHNPFKSQSQSHPQSPQQKQRPHPVYPWSAHAPPSGRSLSPFPLLSHAHSTTATSAGELFLFGGYFRTGPGSSDYSTSNDLIVFSTRDFSTTFLRNSGEVPSPRLGHAAVLTNTTLLIWGGRAPPGFRDVPNQHEDDSFYLLNLGTSNLLISKPTAADRNFFAFQYRESGLASWSMVPGPAVVSAIP
jgi:galactose oxidase-like protein